MKNVFYERVTFFDASINLLITYHRHAAQISLAFNTEIEMLVKDRTGPPKEKPIYFFWLLVLDQKSAEYTWVQRVHVIPVPYCNS